MPDVRYVIDINVNRNGDDGNPNTPNQQNQDNTKPGGGAGKKSAAMATALYVASRAKDYATSRVQMFTGSSAKQAYVNSALKLVGYGAAIVANPILGTTALAFDLATSAIDYGYAVKMERVELEQRQRLLGALSYGRSR